MFHEIHSVRSYDGIRRVMFQNEKNTTFEVSELNLGWDIDFPIEFTMLFLHYILTSV